MRRLDVRLRERENALNTDKMKGDLKSTQTPGATIQTPSTTEQFSVKDVNHILMEFLMFMGRVALVCYPVYLTGSFGLSISWILLSLLMWTMWKNNRKWKDVRIGAAVEFLENERRVIDKEVKALNNPAWVRTPDIVSPCPSQTNFSHLSLGEC